ncbi:MAG: tRNA preQ1(34) S-adenosylmethionine ribosyltransferase-isomerase QueA [Rickettsiaceae bacterium]|nr:MAG: tRNA preQ1(34) S-adenosylmethionine ribosyltransferase-isomerase QueA [Rickettsiaceae bacterium]
MKLSDFDFFLPKELIAQEPSMLRDHSALLITDQDKKLIHTKFYNIIDYLKEGDVLVFNNSKVIKSKIILTKLDRTIELFFSKQINTNNWRGFAKPAKKLKEGDVFFVDTHKIIITKKLYMGEIEAEIQLDQLSFFEFLNSYGQMPLPPYIKSNKDKEAFNTSSKRYQTVYSDILGSVAAPTAGLHFTDELIDKIKMKGIHVAFLHLHVGTGTFMPIKSHDIEQHTMHSEYCNIPIHTAEVVNKAKIEGRRIIAVGTTSLRALESAACDNKILAKEFETDIFIKPGFKFQIVDCLITNFHLPKSTLLVLACAFSGYTKIMRAYYYAIEQKMRFFSYGDAMLLLKSEDMT